MSPCSCTGRKFPCCTSAQLRFQSFYPSLKLEKPRSFIQVIILSNVSVLSGQWSHPHSSKVITVCGGSSVNMLDSILHCCCCCVCVCVCVCTCAHRDSLENMSGNGSSFFFFQFLSKGLNVLNRYLKLFSFRMFFFPEMQIYFYSEILSYSLTIHQKFKNSKGTQKITWVLEAMSNMRVLRVTFYTV